MGLRKVANFHARQLARELIQLRLDARLTQVEVASAIEVSDRKISRFETGQLPGYHELHALLDLYGVLCGDWQPYVDTWRLSNRKDWWYGLKLRDYPYVSIENEATTMRDVALTYLPQLLQSEDYARERLRTSEPPPNRQRLGTELHGLQRRQELLNGDNPIILHALIYEPVLHNGLDQAQLKLLLNRAAQPNITIQIIRTTDIPLGGLDSPFSVLSFPHKDETDIAYIHSPIGPNQTDKPSHIAILRRTFRNLTKHAMNPEASYAYIQQLLS